MNRDSFVIAVLIGFISLAHAKPMALSAGEPFTKARASLYANGWRADPLAHATTGEYWGLDRILVQSGYSEVDYCSVGKSFCVLQYKKGEACLRLYTQGEQIRAMKVESWTGECRERGAGESEDALPADVRYSTQWRDECERREECAEADAFLLKLRKKYARNPAILKLLNSGITPP